MAEKFKVGFIATGGRSVCYGLAYSKMADNIEICALADPNAGNRRAMIQKSEIKNSPAEYDNWQDMISKHDLDGVIISSPNFQHAEQTLGCLEKGIKCIALEKPVATTKEDCEKIIEAEKKHGARILIGFVLRSTPFYGKIHELISSGAIGRVCSIQADELPGLGVSSIMNRSDWRRYSEKSGGAMLEKSCHDMDILNWMLNSKPLSLNSYGGRTIFNPNPLLPQKCDGCKMEKECIYYKKPVFSGHEDKGEEIMHEFMRYDNACIYNIDKDNFDTQSVCIRYANGAIVNFMLNFNCQGSRAGRNFHAIGQKGRIWGNFHEGSITLYDNASRKEQSFNIKIDGSGHGGGDKKHALILRKMLQEPGFRPEQSASAGYLSAVMCFASDISVTEERRVHFRYKDDGKADIV